MRSLLLTVITSSLLAFSLSSLAADQRAQADTRFPVVKLETNYGKITVRLNRLRAPRTVENFLMYVQEGSYNKTLFHRVVPGFVIQGGGLNINKQLLPIKSEVINESGNGLSNRQGTIAMARRGDPHSGNRQFFFNLADNESLDPNPGTWGYAVFGEVIEGKPVVEQIAELETNTDPVLGWPDVPIKPVILRRATLVSAAEK